jgi:hypothetical protein
VGPLRLATRPRAHHFDGDGAVCRRGLHAWRSALQRSRPGLRVLLRAAALAAGRALKRSKKKFLKSCTEVCAGCAWRPGTPAYEARLGRSTDPLDADLPRIIEEQLTVPGGAFYCHEYGVPQPDGSVVVPEDREKLCVGWVAELRSRWKSGRLER